MKMKRVMLILPMLLMPGTACMAQFPNTGGGGTPGGTSGQIQTNNGSGGFGALPVPLGISSGGTGTGTTGANSLPSGFAASGTNADITSLTALTGAQIGGYFGGVTTVSTSTATLTASSGSLVEITYSGGNCTITLPDATTCAGKPFLINQTTANQGLISPVNSQTVGGVSGTGVFSLSAHAMYCIISDGANWLAFTPAMPQPSQMSTGQVLWVSNKYINVTSVGTSGQPLQSGGTSVPVWGYTVEATTTTTASTLALTATSSRNQKLNCASNAITVTLNDATACANKRYTFTKSDSTTNAVTFNTTSSQTVSGIASGVITLTQQWQTLTIYSDGSNWIIDNAPRDIPAPIQTTVNGSSSGSFIYVQPVTGPSEKKVIIYCNNVTDTGTTITYPTPFTHTPAIIANDGLTIVTISNTSVTIPATTSQSGFIILEGF